MRITIDTELQAIIVPNSFYYQIDKLNDIILAAGGNKLDYEQYIKDCFKLAMETKIVRQSDVGTLTPHKKKKTAAKAKEGNKAQEESKGEDK